VAKYRAGIIACGLIAEGAHLPAYRKITEIEVVAGTDLSAGVRERWQQEFGIRRMYADAREMLEQEQLDIVSICTWPPLRPEMVELACAAGVKGILAEKPMAVDLAGCDRMIAAAERAGTVLVIGHQRRFHDRYVKARELIDAGAIGDLVQITGYGGGDLLTGGTHTVDIIRYLVHDVPAEWVIGQIDRREPGFANARLGLQQWEETHLRYGHHIETGAYALIQFRGGVRATVEGGIVMRPNRRGWPCTIYGTDGMVEVAGDRIAPEAGFFPVGDNPERPWLRARVRGEADWVYPAVEPNDAFQAEIEALIHVIEHGGTHPLDGRSARAGHEILMAIYESARRRARIDLPLQEQDHPLEALIAAGEV
jgi:UDP-N-acetylglucosamine 3-dehydrogenase